MKLIILIVTLLFVQISLSQYIAFADFSKSTPKKDLRGVFLTTAFNLDWPSSKFATPETHQAELISILNDLQRNGYNTIFFQVRPACDALYDSTIEPWSNYLTSIEGVAPIPFWDPLQFIISESHKRGLDLHAWLNPYRAKNGTYTNAATHPLNTHPSWILTAASNTNLKILDPGLPAVQNHIVSVVRDIATRYDVDGIHFDDYFYPSSFMVAVPNNQDSQSFINYNPNNLSLADWRRNNGNLLIGMVYNVIQTINSNLNKNIVFGVSPAGIWKSGTPLGITGTSSFKDQFYDPLAWLDSGTVDYLAPQTYWKTTGPQDYKILSKWWNDQVKARSKQVYMSQAYYKMTDNNQWLGTEIQQQINLNRARQMDATFGQIAYRYLQIKNNNKFINTLLNTAQYQFKSFAPPILGFGKDSMCANAPLNIRFDGLNLKWDIPTAAADGDLPRKYVIYGFNSADEAVTNKEDGSKIIDIISETEYLLTQSEVETKHFVVSSLDKNNNENGVFSKTLSNVLNNDSESAIYPNPFINKFNISSRSNDTIAEIQLYDLTGKLVWQQEYSPTTEAISVNPISLSKGIYVGRIFYTNNTSHSFRMVKE